MGPGGRLAHRPGGGLRWPTTDPPPPIDDRPVALVTGAGSGVGRATAAELARRGYEVVATARRAEALEPLTEAGVERRLQLDVTDDGSVLDLLAAVPAVDVLVNNAGVTESGPVERLPHVVVRRVMETNFFGPLRLTQAYLPWMRERERGTIVNVSSVQGRISTPLGATYSASKFALEAMSEALHYEVGHFGVRVVIVEPGYIAPGMKGGERHGEGPPYDELRRQYEGTDQKVLGGRERPGPETVAIAIAGALEADDPPLRLPVGDDAEMILSTRRQLDDAAFEAAMRATLDLDW